MIGGAKKPQEERDILEYETMLSPFTGRHDVLVLAGIELIFFLVAGTVLCFGFSVRIMLITLWCFSCC